MIAFPQSELESYFHNSVCSLAEKNGMTYESTLNQLKEYYDGYCFSSDKCEGIYNPFSLETVLLNQEFGCYWFSTGNQTLVGEYLKRTKGDFDRLKESERTDFDLFDLAPEFFDPVPFLMQNGYLTIKSYDPQEEYYKIGFPNKIVEREFKK